MNSSGQRVGIFLTGVSLLFLEVLCTRVLGVILGNYFTPYVVGISLLGMGLAGTLAALMPENRAVALCRRGRPALCLAAGLAALFMFAAMTGYREFVNAEIDRFLALPGTEAIGGLFRKKGPLSVVLLGLLMLIPNCLYGLVVALTFRFLKKENYPAFYFLDLLGASLGCILCVLALEYGGFRLPLILAACLPCAAGMAFAGREQRAWRRFLAALFLLTPAALSRPEVAAFLEPRPNLSMAARTRGTGVKPKELWHTWNSYARVAAISLRDTESGRTRLVFSHGEGEGHVSFRPFDPESGEVATGYNGPEITAALGVPRRALVLFAGVGLEVMALDRLSGGRTDITAVELNGKML